jgi:KipI family sensor histidine kinase inhibitor
MGDHMKVSVITYGDTAALVATGDVSRAHRVAAALQAALDGGGAPVDVHEIVIGFDSVVVQLRPDPDGHARVLAWLRDLVSRMDGDDDGGDTAVPVPRDRGGAPVQIPVDFDGPDLHAVASTLGTTPADVVTLLTGADLQVAFLGFSPGFPYLVGLPPQLAGLHRLPTPRTSVRAGSVAVAGGFASVYPQSTPGGWMVLGHTKVTLFDPHRPPYALLRPGDRVRFSVMERDWPAEVPGSEGPDLRPLLAARGPRRAEVLRPGLMSLIQDGGRRGLAGMGVPGAGPADPESMTLANRLVGNAEGAAVLEITVEGPALRFAGAAHCAVVATSAGAVDLSVDGLPCRDGAVVPVEAGQVIDIGRIRAGVRAYLAVAGGFDTPSVVGSRSSDLLCGLGPGPLAVGDQLGLGRPTRPHGLLAPPARRRSEGPAALRVIAGPHGLDDGAWEDLVAGVWTVEGASNRVGVRLTGPRPVPAAGARPIASTGMVTGAIQVPPDGYPIVLMPDHATVGGYPVVGCVISSDLPALGQLGPGDPVRFTEVDLDEALRIAIQRERALASRISGWFPTRAGT